jgi:hypothetical protein
MLFPQHIFIDTRHRITDSLSPQSPDPTPIDFNFRGCGKDKVYIPPLPQFLLETVMPYRLSMKI